MWPFSVPHFRVLPEQLQAQGRTRSGQDPLPAPHEERGLRVQVRELKPSVSGTKPKIELSPGNPRGTTARRTSDAGRSITRAAPGTPTGSPAWTSARPHAPTPSRRRSKPKKRWGNAHVCLELLMYSFGLVQIQEVVVEENSDVVFEVSYEANPPATTMWKYNGAELEMSEKMSREESGSLKIAGATMVSACQSFLAFNPLLHTFCLLG